MVPEYVIVTLQTESGIDLGDFQLPTAVSTEKIGAFLLDGLRKQFYQQLGSWKKLELCRQGFLLENKKTLADHGIWDGSILTVREGTK